MTTKTKLFSALAIMLMALVLMPFAGSQPAYAEEYVSGTVYVSPAHACEVEVHFVNNDCASIVERETPIDFEYQAGKAGDDIRLIAVPNLEREFEGWYVRNTSQPIFTTIDSGWFDPRGYCDDSGHLEIVAVFDGGSPMLDVGPYNITATAYPADAGIVQVPVGPFDEATTVELEVTTTFPGYEFVGWMEDGAIVSTQTAYSFYAVGDRSLTARFRSTTPHAVEISATENGSVTPNPASAKELETVTLDVTPADGFELDTLTVKDEGGNTISVAEDANGKPTFSMPAGKAVVSATFKEIPAVVTVPVSMRFSVYSGNQWIDAEEAGAISSATINGEDTRSLNVASGETAAIHIELATGYMVSAVRVGNDYAWNALDDYSYSPDPVNGTYDIGFTATDGKDSALVVSLNEAVKVTYDVNGGTAGEGWQGETKLMSKGSRVSSLADLSSMVVPPDGQELDCVAITDAGVPRSVAAQDLAGTGHIYDSDVTFKFVWKNKGGQGQDDPPAPPDPPAPASIDGAKVVLSATAFTYDGKAHKPAVKTVGGKALVLGADYTLSVKNAKGAAVASPKAAGTYTVTVTGAGAYAGTAKATYTIKKAANTLSAKAKTKKAVGVKAGKKLKADKLFVVSGANGAVAYKKANKVGGKKISVAKNGTVKVKKGCKEGTYKLKVKVRAAGDANHLASAFKTVTVKVKVKAKAK